MRVWSPHAANMTASWELAPLPNWSEAFAGLSVYTLLCVVMLNNAEVANIFFFRVGKGCYITASKLAGGPFQPTQTCFIQRCKHNDRFHMPLEVCISSLLLESVVRWLADPVCMIIWKYWKLLSESAIGTSKWGQYTLIGCCSLGSQAPSTW